LRPSESARSAPGIVLRAAGLAIVTAIVMTIFITSVMMVADRAVAMDDEQFAARLDEAARLNIEEPWPVSQAILDELRPYLDLADDDQVMTFMMLESRNQALDGRIEASLATVQSLLELDLTPAQRLIAHGRAANVGYVARRFETTFRHLNTGLELLQDPELERHAVNFYSVAAYIYVLADEPDDAVAFGRKALDIAHRARSLREQCAAHQRMGFVYKRIGDFDAARQQYLAGLADCAETEDELITGTVEYAYADLLQAAGQFEEAAPLFERSLETMERQGYRSGLALARLYRARMALAQNDGERAERLLREALPDLIQDGNDEYVAEAHRGLADLRLEEGRYEDAIDHLLASMEAREAHLQQVRDRRSALLQVQFAVAEKEQELARLREQQRIAELERKSQAQQSQLRIALASGVALLVVLLVLLLVRAVRDRRRFRRLSRRDALTALSNHTRFFELAEQTRNLAESKRRNYTFVLGDIDHFKQVNDRFGHVTGDAVLRQVSAVLRQEFGDKGIIGRVGGEEFGLALPGPDQATVLRSLAVVQERLRSLEIDGRSIPITMSFGVARPRPGETFTELRERADRRLYGAKRAGRDRVVHADDVA
jgi:diguanylate cyclase (GGDEF)-like protein